MVEPSESALRQLSEHLGIEPPFLKECLSEAVIEIHEVDGQLLVHGTTFRLRRLQRICHTFSVDLSVALLIAHLSERTAELQREIDALRPR